MDKSEEQTASSILDNVDLSDLEGTRDFFESLSSEEKELALQILQELESDGKSDKLKDIYNADYDESPVDVYTFVTDPYYMGSILDEKIYPRWLEHMNEFLNPTKKYIEICLTGDTKIPLMNGKEKTMKELWEEDPDEFFVFSYDFDNNKNVAGRAHTVKRTRKETIYKVTLDNGEIIRGTGDHNLINREGQKVKIKDLVPGTSLFPFYRRITDEETGDKKRIGYKQVYNPNSEEWEWEHYLADAYNLKNGLDDASREKRIRHHVDFDKLNNAPTNIKRMEPWAHRRLHGEYIKSLWEDPDIRPMLLDMVRRNGKKASKKLWNRLKTKKQRLKHLESAFKGRDKWLKSEEGLRTCIENLNVFNNAVKAGEDWAVKIYEENIKVLEEENQKLWNSEEEKYVEARKKHAESIRQHMLNSNQSTEMSEAWWGSEEGQKEKERLSQEMSEYNKAHPIRRDDVTVEKIVELYKEGITSTTKIAEKFECSGSKIKSVMAKHSGSITEFRNWMNTQLNNHKVISVEVEPETDWVYNFTVDEYHNYQLSAGILSANCLTGAIGSGKTTIGLIALCYHLHKILCLKNPQEYYGLLDSDEIVFAVFNATLELANNVGFDKLSKMVRASPFFSEKLIDNPRAPEQINFPKNISIEVGSQFSHVLGKHVFAALLDEANFQETDSVDIKDSQVMRSYNGLYRRMESRFLGKGGSLPGQLFLVSSKNNKSSFLEIHIDNNKNRDSTYIVDEPIWEFKKHLGNYSGETFPVMIGDQQRDSQILEEGENSPVGYEIIDVPIEYKYSFEKDIDWALKDIAGKATYSDVNLIKNRARVREGIVDYIEGLGEWKNPFNTDLIVLDFDDDTTEIRDFMDIPYFKKYLEVVGMHQPRAIHIDVGVTGDALGIAMGFTEGKREVVEIDLDGSKHTREKETYRIDFGVRITNLEGKELPLYKILTFIVWLKEIGVNIRMASTDGYQSTMLRQLLRKRGIDTELVSVDKTDDAYIYLKDAHMDKRILFAPNDLYLLELFDLLHFSKQKKVDHPKKNSKGQKGSKDIADSIAGVIFDLVNDKQEIRNADERPIDYEGFFGDDDFEDEAFEREVLNYAIGDYIKQQSKNRDEDEGKKNFKVY